MKSLKAEREAQVAASEPILEAKILICGSIQTPSGREDAEAKIVSHIRDRWQIMFANLDGHSSTMVYTLTRSTAPTVEAPAGIAMK